MSLSFGSIFISLCICLILTLYLIIILKCQVSIFFHGIKIVFLGIIAVLFRIILPINFPFTITFPAKGVFAQVCYFFYNNSIWGMPIISMIFTIWFIGVFISCIFMIYKNITTKKILLQCCKLNEHKAKKEKQLLITLGYSRLSVAVMPGISSPCIIGLIKPILVLPNYDIPERYLKYIILHEVEHYRNFDLWFKLFLEITVCIYWWNPIVYLLRSKMQLAMEISNDVAVTRKLDDQAKLDYTQFLVSMSKTYTGNKTKILFANLSIPLVQSKSDLEIRVMNIIKGLGKHASNAKYCFLINTIVIILIVFFSYTFVFEAYYIPKEVENTSFLITEEDSYFIETEQGFELYINGEYQLTVKEIDPTLHSLKIIQGE